MLTTISASNGGGYVPQEEIAEALGAWMLALYAGVESDKGCRENIGPEFEHWRYKKRIYRVQLFPGSLQRFTTDKMHFDYIKEV